MKAVTPKSGWARGLWAAMLILGLVLLGTGVAFASSGFEMILLTVLFGGAGIFITLEALERLFSRR